MEKRKIRKEELSKVRDLHRYCTGRSWSDSEPGEKELAFYDNREIIGAFQGDELMSIIRNYTFFQNIRGVVKSMGGISHVATFPEYRMRGYSKELVVEAFMDMRDKGQCVSMLHPFKESYYRKFGYVSANDNISIEIDMESISCTLEENHDITLIRKKAVQVQQEFEEFKCKLDDEYHGTVLLNNMSKGYWECDHENVLVIFIKENEETIAQAKYIMIKSGDNPRLFVPEMYWRDEKSRKLLFSYFTKHEVQLKKIEMRVKLGVNFYSWFKDTPKRLRVNMNPNPWMVRVVRVSEAFSGISVKVDGEVQVKIHDDICWWNSGVYKFISKDGKLNAIKLSEQNDFQIEMDIREITSLLYGINDLCELTYRKCAEVSGGNELHLLEQWFPKKTIYNMYYY